MLEIKNLSFNYGRRKKEVLSHFSLSLLREERNRKIYFTCFDKRTAYPLSGRDNI